MFRLKNERFELILIVLFTFFVLSENQYKHVLGENIFNCSWFIILPKPLVLLGQTIGEYFDVVKLLNAIELGILLLQFSHFQYRDVLLDGLYKYHHLSIIPMTTIVGFYLIFKQRRPTYDVKNKCPIGTYYGMPSGDVLYATLTACFIWQKLPILSVLVVLSIVFSRISRGYHTLAQSIVGFSFGIGFYFLYDILGDYFHPLNWILAFFLQLLVLFDPNLKKVRKYDFNNLHSWLFMDAAGLIFDFLLCAPQKYSIFPIGFPLIKKTIVGMLCAITSNFIGYYIAVNGISLTLVWILSICY